MKVIEVTGKAKRMKKDCVEMLIMGVPLASDCGKLVSFGLALYRADSSKKTHATMLLAAS